MAELGFQGEALGHVYAQALINQAQKLNALDEITGDVHALTEVLNASPRFAEFAEAATISDIEKMDAIEKIFSGRMHPLVVQTLRSMAQRERLVFVRGFIAAYDAILAKLANKVDVELTTAQQLSPESFTRVQAAVGQALGKTPEFKVRVDPDLLGGLTLRIGDTMIDGSVQTQLGKIKRQLQQNGLTTLQQRMPSVVI